MGDTKPRVLLIVTTLLVPLSVYANIQEFRALHERVRELETQRTAEVQSRRGGLVFTSRDTDSALRVIREPTIGLTFVNGAHARLPLYWDVGPAGLRYGPPAGAYAGGPSTPRLDVEYLIRIVLGLFALLLGLETIGGERQHGTLRPLLAQPVSNVSLILGKTGANGALILGCVVWTVAVAYATVVLSNPSPGISFAVVVGVVGLSWTYLMFCFFLGFACASIASTVPRAQILALSVWLLQSAVSVPLVSSLVDVVARLRPRADFESELQRAYSITNREASNSLGTAFLARIGRSDWLAIDKDPKEQARMKIELEPLWADFAQRWRNDMVGREIRWQAARQRQESAVSWASTVTAGLLFNRLAADLVGTGARSADLWHQAAAAHQSRLHEPLVARRPELPLRIPTDETYSLYNLPRGKPLRVAEAPEFERPAAMARGIQAADALRLIAQSLAVMALGCVAVVRLRGTAFEDVAKAREWLPPQ